MISHIRVAVVALALLLQHLLPSASSAPHGLKQTCANSRGGHCVFKSKKKKNSPQSVLEVEVESRRSAAWQCDKVTTLRISPSWEEGMEPEWYTFSFVDYLDWDIVLRTETAWKRKTLLEIEPTQGTEYKREIVADCEKFSTVQALTRVNLAGDYAVLRDTKKSAGKADETKLLLFSNHMFSLRSDNVFCSSTSEKVSVKLQGQGEGDWFQVPEDACVEVRVVDSEYSIDLDELGSQIYGDVNMSGSLNKTKETIGTTDWKSVKYKLAVVVNAVAKLYGDHYKVKATNALQAATGITEAQTHQALIEQAQKLGEHLLPLIKKVDQYVSHPNLNPDAQAMEVQFQLYVLYVKSVEWFFAVTPVVSACLCCSEKPPFTIAQNVTDLCRVAYTLGSAGNQGGWYGNSKAAVGAFYNALKDIGGYVFGKAKTWFNGQIDGEVDPLAGSFNPTEAGNAKICSVACSLRSLPYEQFKHSHVRNVPGFAFSMPYFNPESVMTAAGQALMTAFSQAA